MRKTLLRLVGMLLLVAPCLAHAAQYDYDALGRLVRSIDAQGRVTEYVYDPAGNLLQVIQGGAATAPAVANASPGTIRRNQALQFQISGTGLSGVSLSSDDPAITFKGVSVTPTGVSFRMLVFRDASLGAHALTLRNAAGTVTVAFEVLDEITYVVGPAPLAIPPDGSTRRYAIAASAADPNPLTLTVSSLHPSIALPVTTSVSLAAGATETTGTVRGLAAGLTTLRFSSPDLVEPLDIPVGVTSEFAGATRTRSRLMGLVKGDPTAPGANTPSTTRSPALGLVKGDPSAPSSNTPSTTYSPGLGIEKN